MPSVVAWACPSRVEVEIFVLPTMDRRSKTDWGWSTSAVRLRSWPGYLIEEQLDTTALVDGWFNTERPRVARPAARAVHLRGRQAEVINVSGMKVLPSEVEEVIGSLPGVAEVKVYAGSSQAGAHHVRAAVVAAEEVDVGRIKAHCEEHLVYYKRPSRIILMDALPRTSAGKIARDLLP